MTGSNEDTGHLSQDELVASALGTGSADDRAHLEVCDICRSEMESYRTILTGIRNVFSNPAPHVHVFQCQHGLMTHDHACTVEHPASGDRLTINCHNGWLNGRLTRSDRLASDTTETTVRLFSRQGLVGSVAVDEEGVFLVRCLNNDERHSMTIVLPGDGTALQLLSSSETGGLPRQE